MVWVEFIITPIKRSMFTLGCYYRVAITVLESSSQRFDDVFHGELGCV